ncbi:DUF1249 domain-containing protein [Methanosarcina mazei]|uniref:DUF1249 domain-containing protein n=1 Tax=Methanosarcina mazei TaxID=2209 RepID=A0A0F8RQ81_METMZ|nr:DUF1249 domain-containing protein [Methanosarcina mazei]KKH38976.1 hypothetical protein DU71_01330 [Methanosarcina mazei]KKH56866.1 hypothetical protein DU72_01670 [Methanosarcina mazei]QIB91272.1 DUF1249 domain-containing protein [Methanosarcina mazei]
MTEKIQQKIFSQLVKIGIIDENGAMKHEYMRFASEGMMDLHVDRLPNNMLSVAHNGKLNGDVMADPDMQVLIHPDHKEAEAMTFQNDYLGIFQEVYPEPGKYRPKLKEELNDFLADWLRTIIEVQKYKLAPEDEM